MSVMYAQIRQEVTKTWSVPLSRVRRITANCSCPAASFPGKPLQSICSGNVNTLSNMADLSEHRHLVRLLAGTDWQVVLRFTVR